MEEEVNEEVREEVVEEEATVEEVVEKKEEKRERKADDNVVYVGKKGVMSYVLAVVTQFNNGEKEVIIKARGNAISRAVDTAEIVRQRFVNDVKEPKEIKISTE